MPEDRILTIDEVPDAAAIQTAIDSLSQGGRVILPAMELTLDRGIELYSGMELVGQGEATILRKGPGRLFPLSGYHNYGMCDVPLVSADGLVPGMTVSVLDDKRLGFYETFARITWVDGNWVGLDHGIEADYSAECEPRLATAYPMVFGHGVADVGVRDLVLEGNRRLQDVGMGGCRGSAVYFAKSQRIEVAGVRERDYCGEGLGFQMCRDVIVRDCTVDDNAGNGLHPGAGSTNFLFERCASSGNDKSGFFFCVRANRITVKDCRFDGNGNGVSIGTRDCHNLIDSCTINHNRGPGVLVRDGAHPVEVHSCAVVDCSIAGNGREDGAAQVVIPAEAHDLIFQRNRIDGGGTTTGITAEAGCKRLFLDANHFTDCRGEVMAAADSQVEKAPVFDRGYGAYDEKAFRHLPLTEPQVD